MQDDKSALKATLIVVFTGVLWGFYWLPVRTLAGMGLAGPWGTAAITAAATVFLAPVALRGQSLLCRERRRAIAFVALGGAAFSLYSVALVYGRVAIIILLFFLTPVWSTLIARYVMGWRTPILRYFAIAFGLAGLGVMLGAQGQVPLPRNTGEWIALLSGMLWAVATTGIRATPELPAPQAAFVFAGGATVTTLCIGPLLSPWQSPDGSPLAMLAIVLGTGGLWWGLSMASLMWATVRLDPARVGILLMAEVLIGAASAAVLASEALSPLEMIGGALVLCAGLLEVWPVRRVRRN
ncbi:EamA family transporter [Sulfitobacter alexandrii]|uniref:EamA family transporter n=1 Tax=Sulfitobacter alexandrii TaxID=1917485 RepID=A0A1J0WL43_9RHOB|nr:DMT family transporter [Sulfitobacter alexandrii]APE45003.1 EamA family transporter [Sulfitobacter alexandrii]